MKAIFKALLAGLPLVALGACSSDEPIGAGGQTAEKTEVRYLKVNLVNSGTPETRVGEDNEYADGTEAENKIRTVDFLFYDADKNYHSHVHMPLSAPVDPTTAGVTNPAVHGFYETDVPVSLVQGEKMPNYVLCIINAVDASWYANKSMAQAQQQLLGSFYSNEDGGGKYFAMNNSVYYGRDEVSGKDNELIMATPFDSNKLRTMTELKNMTSEELNNVTIDIYVERYCAKVQLNLTSDAIEDYVSGNGITLKFEPKSWGMNAYEKQFFFLKSFRATSGTDLNFDTFDTMDGILFSGWNKPDHFRSFWARTPAYYDNDYPLVADDILDPKVDGEPYPYSVYYHSFKEATNTVGQPQYVMESTMKGTRLTGQDMPEQYLPLTSIPSVVLVGQYKIGGEAKTFYTYQKGVNGHPNVYSATAGDIPGVSETILYRMLENQSVVLKKIGTGYAPVRNSDVEAASTLFTVEHPKKEVRAGLKIGGDLVTLQIQGENSGYYFYDADNSQYVEINSTAAIRKVNRLLYQNLGGAHAYINGMAFFSAPIQHWGWYRHGNENYNKPMAEWDWKKMKTGDFGIVRNHIYNVNVSKISGLGTGIISDEDPLLPPTDKVSYAVRFRVNILKWATLPTQSWEW